MTQIKKIYWILIMTAFSYVEAFAADPPPVGGDPTGGGGGVPIGGGAPIGEGYMVLIFIVLLYGVYKYYVLSKNLLFKNN